MARMSCSRIVGRRAFVPSPWIALALTVCCGGSGGSTSTQADGGAATEGGGASSGTTGSSGSSGSSGGSSGSSGSSSGSDDAATGPESGSADGSQGSDSGDGSTSLLSGKQVLIWMPTYLGSFSANLKAVTSSSPKAFTQVSPDFYNLNYNYQSGAAQISGDNFDGLSVADVATQVHAAGMLLIPLVYAGAGNSGTDQGIQNVLNDSPTGAQDSFITSMVTEAMTRQYDGWNLDWEVGNTDYSQYGMKYVSFLTAFKAALHAQHMILTIDLGDWYIRQCGNNQLVDLTQIGASVDAAIIEDYAGSYGNPLASCPGGTPPAQQDCSNNFGALMNIMCDVTPTSSVSIGLIQESDGTGTNPFLDKALDAVSTVGFTSVAVWPDNTPFLSTAGVPNGDTWYSLLAAYLAK